MRLPDRVRLVLDQLMGRQSSKDLLEAGVERSVERIDEMLLDLRRVLADALVLRRAAEATRDQLVAEARETPSNGSASRAERADAELANLLSLEAMLGAAETELHEQVSSIRRRMAVASAREAGAAALADLARAARAAEVRSEAAREAVSELQSRVAIAEGRLEG